MKLSKIWTSNLKNRIFGGLFPAIDPFDNDSFYIGDGWGSSYSSMKLRKYSFSTGHEIQSVNIKNNVRCLRFETNQTDLFAVTNDKVIQLDRKTLDVKTKFEKGIQRYNDFIESNDKDTLLMMNYRMEFLFIYNHKTKEGRKKKIGSCCGLFKKSDNEYYVFNGRDGRILIYDLLSNAVTELTQTHVFHSVQVHDNNLAFLRLGYIEYDAGNIWQIKPSPKIRIIDLTNFKKQKDINTGIDFQFFKVDNDVIYLWKLNNIWRLPVDQTNDITKVSAEKNEYIMEIFPDKGKIVTESDTSNDNKTLNCYDCKI